MIEYACGCKFNEATNLSELCYEHRRHRTPYKGSSDGRVFYQGPPPDTAIPPGEAGLRVALRNMSRDMHQSSTRPCGTCREITVALGEPFGCYAYQAQRASGG